MEHIISSGKFKLVLHVDIIITISQISDSKQLYKTTLILLWLALHSNTTRLAQIVFAWLWIHSNRWKHTAASQPLDTCSWNASPFFGGPGNKERSWMDGKRFTDSCRVVYKWPRKGLTFRFVSYLQIQLEWSLEECVPCCRLLLIVLFLDSWGFLLAGPQPLPSSAPVYFLYSFSPTHLFNNNHYMSSSLIITILFPSLSIMGTRKH